MVGYPTPCTPRQKNILGTGGPTHGPPGVGWSADLWKGHTAYQSGDYATALHEWKSLAKQGIANAQYNLGVLYQQGHGVPQDDKTAVKWWRLAAEQGDADSQTNLGVMYADGEGVLKDYVYTHMWGSIGASNGSENGGKLRDFVATKMTPTQIADAQKLAREYVRKYYKGC